jgi:hypothetical protein
VGGRGRGKLRGAAIDAKASISCGRLSFGGPARRENRLEKSLGLLPPHTDSSSQRERAHGLKSARMAGRR